MPLVWNILGKVVAGLVIFGLLLWGGLYINQHVSDNLIPFILSLSWMLPVGYWIYRH